MVAQTVDECKTKNELFRIAAHMQRGMSGTRTMSCLKQLQAEGKVKTARKCVQWGKCYYDPPQEIFNPIRNRSIDLDQRFQELKKAQLENLKNDFEEALKRLEEANSNDSAKAPEKYIIAS